MYEVPKPDPQVFQTERSSFGRFVRSEPRNIFEIERVDYNEGINVWKKGWLHPTKGFVYPEAMYAVNTVKRMFMTVFSILTPFSFFRRVKLIAAFTRTVYNVVEPHLVKEEFLTPFARELGKIIERETENKLFADIIAHIFEYDNAYRFRAQDILTELDRSSFLRNPKREIDRLYETYIRRELDDRVKSRVTKVYNLVGWLVPFISKKLKRILSECDLKSLRMDEVDKYNCLYRGEYLYQGLTYEQRQNQLLKLHDGKLPQPYNIKKR